jgi:uncharacterized protein (TIGR04168 family)
VERARVAILFPSMTIRVAVVGDVHLAFGPKDVLHLDSGAYDLVLFVGDLTGYAHRGGLRVAKYVQTIRTPTLVLPGNHDAVNAAQLLAEVSQNERAIGLVSGGQKERVAELRKALAPAIMAGYSVHPFARAGTSIDIVACRPHTFGGPHLAFRPYLMDAFGIATMDESAARLRSLVDQTTAGRLVFFAHNGPTGLGEGRDAIWGRDFKKPEIDFGDPDLEAAIAHAKRSGKHVLAVLAGHMHHALRGGGTRKWIVEREGTLYLNAARVPRVFKEAGREKRHVVEVVLTGDHATAKEVLFDG